uniref:Uncharacterized protein n=1 Tax=Anguilla anguilla TaxID=7936 RepID=A0A0E9QQP8_ANGAN
MRELRKVEGKSGSSILNQFISLLLSLSAFLFLVLSTSVFSVQFSSITLRKKKVKK